MASASKNAMQQAGPICLSFPMSMDWSISIMHPEIFITEDKYFATLDKHGIPWLDWNGSEKRMW